MNSKAFRNSELFLRNKFQPDGIWGFPLIRKQQLDLDNIALIACSDTKANDQKNTDIDSLYFCNTSIKPIRASFV